MFEPPASTAPVADVIGMRFINALAYAADAHSGQLRKGSDIPYITHPISVAMIVVEHGGDEELAMAGLLHDVIEDCDIVYASNLRAIFGDRVADLVEGMTDGVRSDTGEKAPWRPRKEAFLARLRAADRDLQLIKAADALHNARCTLADVKRDGEAAMTRISRGDYLWYLREVAHATRELGAIANELWSTCWEIELLLEQWRDGGPLAIIGDPAPKMPD